MPAGYSSRRLPSRNGMDKSDGNGNCMTCMLSWKGTMVFAPSKDSSNISSQRSWRSSVSHRRSRSRRTSQSPRMGMTPSNAPSGLVAVMALADESSSNVNASWASRSSCAISDNTFAINSLYNPVRRISFFTVLLGWDSCNSFSAFLT